MICETVTISNKLGLHARASTKLVHLASRYSSEIYIQCNGRKVNAKSIMGVMLLAATQGTLLTLTINGEDQQEAWQAIKDLVENKFHENE